jgi:hypothetical protein
MSTVRIRLRPLFMTVGLVLGASFGGCSMSDDRLASMMVAPGKFALYTCPEMVQSQKENLKRQREFEVLMAKAGQESSGRFVSAMAYRPEYLSLRGEMKDLHNAAAEKQCVLPDPATVSTDDAAAPPAVSQPR